MACEGFRPSRAGTSPNVFIRRFNSDGERVASNKKMIVFIPIKIQFVMGKDLAGMLSRMGIMRYVMVVDWVSSPEMWVTSTAQKKQLTSGQELRLLHYVAKKSYHGQGEGCPGDRRKRNQLRGCFWAPITKHFHFHSANVFHKEPMRVFNRVSQPE